MEDKWSWHLLLLTVPSWPSLFPRRLAMIFVLHRRDELADCLRLVGRMAFVMIEEEKDG